jgi:hypothetical protein
VSESLLGSRHCRFEVRDALRRRDGVNRGQHLAGADRVAGFETDLDDPTRQRRNDVDAFHRRELAT